MVFQQRLKLDIQQRDLILQDLKKECPEIYEEYSKDSSVSSSISIEVE